MQQFFVVKADGSRLGPFDGATISQMRLDGAIAADDTVEEAPIESGAEAPGEPRAASESIEGYFAAPPPAAKKTNPLFWVLIAACVLCIPCIFVFAAVLFPVFSQAKISAQMTSSMSDLKKVGRAVMQYTFDNDDQYPLKMDTLSDAWTAIGGYAQMTLPESKNPGHPEYLGNGFLNGAVGTKLDVPHRTFEFFDSAPWTVKKRVVLFADTSVKKVTEEEFQQGVLNGMVEP